MSFYYKSFLFISFVFLLTACTEEKKVLPKEIPAFDIDIITVKKEKLPIWIEYTGRTQASSQQEVRARVKGYLEKIYFQDGEVVTKGDKLFEIESAEYKAHLQTAKAKLRQDKASLKLAKADIDRYAPLVKEGLAPKAVFEQYEATYQEILAKISADEAEVKDALRQLSYSTITAPISGKISARRVDVGNLVGASEATLLTTIVNIDPLYAYFSPTEQAIQKIKKYASKEKLDAFIEVRDGSQSILKREQLKGFIDFSNNSVDPLTSTVTMRATIENKEFSMLPGTFVYVNIFVTDQHSFMMVPPEVIFEDQMGKYLFVENNGTLSKELIEIGFTNRYYSVINKGLKEGSRVVVSGLIKLRDKMKVNPTDTTDTKGIKAIIKAKNLIPKES